MSISGSTISRPTIPTTRPAPTDAAAPTRVVEVEPSGALGDGALGDGGLGDISCWRLLTARVPLTLLLDLALSSADELEGIHAELLAEPTSLDWVPKRTAEDAS